MLSAIDRLKIDQLRDATIWATWIHWAALGAFIDADREPRSMADPEALLIMSLIMREHERRLWDIIASFAKNGSRLLSVQRVKNLLGQFPDPAKDRVSEFAELAVQRGNDFRWRSLKDSQTPLKAREQEIWRAYPSRWSPSALVPRLRLAFGVGITADLLSYLISLKGEWADARRIALAVGYLARPVRRSADDLAAANLIESAGARPAEYRLDPEKWSSLLGMESDPPKWRFWNLVFPFIAHTLAASESGTWEELSAYMVSSRLRDLMEHHRDAFRMNQIKVPDPQSARGEEFLALYAEALGVVSGWLVEAA